MRVRSTSTLAVVLVAIAVAGCGDDAGPKAPEGVDQSVFERQLKDAQRVGVADFPAVGGKTLQELADTAKAGPQAALATSVLVPGENRLAFGVLDAEGTTRCMARPRCTSHPHPPARPRAPTRHRRIPF